MRSQIFWDRFFMDIAEKVSDLSYDPKTKVGCVVVRDRNILSFSYNGTPSGLSNNMRTAGGEPVDEVLHAETNALAKIARSYDSTTNTTVYTTRAPCLSCAKAIYQAGSVRVVYRDDHSCDKGLNFLQQLYIPTTKVNN